MSALPHIRRVPGAVAPVPPGLLRAWLGTVFEAAGASARLGQRSPGMDALLRRDRAWQGTILGAWNPLSRRFPPRWNDAMHARMLLRLRRARPAPIAAVGRPRRGSWPPEGHVLLPGDPRPALRLARLFRQQAVLALRLRAPCRLVLLR